LRRSVRSHAAHVLELDESLNNLGDFRRAIADDAMDAAALKVSKFGGLTNARVIRDLCADAGIPLTFEDAWGSGIATAVHAHLAASTPTAGLRNTTDLHNCDRNRLAHGAPVVEGGRMRLGAAPALGVEPDLDAPGPPIRVFDGET